MKKVIFNIVAIPLGAMAIVAGEADDSPGLQGLGLLLLLYVFFRSSSELRNFVKGLRKKN